MAAQGVTASPCNDSIYVALRKKPVDSLSVREYTLFQERDRACMEVLVRQQGTTQTAPAAAPVAAPAAAPAAPMFGYVRRDDSKDPATATLFGFILVGGGQMYVGQVGKGIGLLLTAATAVGVGAAQSAASCDKYPYECNASPLIAGEVIALGVWVYGMVDANRAARETNLYVSSSKGRTNVGWRVAVR